jgi:Uma2 family endonuclease
MTQLLDVDQIPTPNIDHLVLEDDAPVDNFQSEKQQRLLVEPLYSSWTPNKPFIAAANVGLFYAINQDGIAPDAFVSLDVEMPADWSQKQNRSYLVWVMGKMPEVVVEIVSNRKGNELGSKKTDYARMGIAYYAVFDPLRQLQKPDEMDGALLKVWFLNAGRYSELPPSPVFWLETVGLALTVWDGVFEGQQGSWLRWCDQSGQVILTGAEGREIARQGQEIERQRADRLAQRLRELGVDPDEETVAERNGQ